MNDQREGCGLAAAILCLVVLLLLIAGGGAFIVFVRQQAMLRSQANAARAEALRAREAVEQAALAERTALKSANERASQQANPPSDNSSSEGKSPAKYEHPEIVAAIESILQAQASAWNAGDVQSFMQYYWNSSDLTFSSGGKTTRGWSDTLKRYVERYPTKEAMGSLRFDQLEVTPLGETAALVLGCWRLDRDSEPVQGSFSLVFRRIDGQWRIIHDHTSRDL